MIRNLLIAAILVGTSPIAAQNAKNDSVIDHRGADAGMNAAEAEAQRSLPHFFAAPSKPRADETTFLLRPNLTPMGDAEFIWANNIVIGGDTITGMLANAPIADGFAKDKRVTIDRALIIDWGYFEGSTMLGNHTTRVMLKSMPPEQAAEVNASLGW